MDMNNDKRNRIYIYGLDSTYRIVKFWYITRAEASITQLIMEAINLRNSRVDITEVYCVDQSYEIFTGARDSMRTNLTEDKVCFKDLLERSGIRIL